MYEWMKKIHMYTGLFTFMAFAVWGATGIGALFLPPLGGYRPPEVSEVRELPFTAPSQLDDRQLAQAIYDSVDLPMTGGLYNLHRDNNHNLAFQAYATNGPRHFTYLEEEGLVRLEFRQNDLANFLSFMHAGHSRRGPPDLPARLWGYYNEFSTWAFLFMALSGIYMWIVTRPELPWARILAGVTTVLTLALWAATR